MGGRRSAYDNALCESVFKTLKSELVDRRSSPTKRELRSASFDYIECLYNVVRAFEDITNSGGDPSVNAIVRRARLLLGPVGVSGKQTLDLASR